MNVLSKNERAALAMHELMKRDQARLRARIDEQNAISLLSDEKLKEMVAGFKTGEPKSSPNDERLHSTIEKEMESV